MPFETDKTEAPEDYWIDWMAREATRDRTDQPIDEDRTMLLAAIEEINTGRGFPLDAVKVIVFERAAAIGWRCSFIDGPIPLIIADRPILTREAQIAENAMNYGMNCAEYLYGTGTA